MQKKNENFPGDSSSNEQVFYINAVCVRLLMLKIIALAFVSKKISLLTLS